MQGFYNITEKIRVQLAQDEFVNTITYGDIFRVDLKKQTIFPLSHVVVNNATIEKNIIRYNISVMAMDIVDISKEAIDNTAIGQFRGNDNEQDVLNTQQAVLLRLLKVLEGGTLFEALYQLDGNPDLQPFTERFENYLAGWVATFDVIIPNDMIACDGATVPSNVCDDAIAITTDSLGNELYSNTIPSGVTEIQVIQDSTYTIEYINGTLIESGSILAEGSVVVQVPNPVVCEDVDVFVGEALVGTYSGGTDVFVTVTQDGLEVIPEDVIVSGGDIDIVLADSVPCPDTTLEVNGTIEGTVASGSTVDIQLSDSGGVVTPTSVTQVGNDFQVVLPDSASVPVGAKLMKTGQTTSYATNDDGDLEIGRLVNFTTLNSDNPFGNTNRFTSEVGTQTYTNGIIIDWSTYDGSTVLGWYKGAFPLETWANALTNATALSVGGFSTWRIPNACEAFSILNYGASTAWNYSPFSITSLSVVWTSTSYNSSTSSAIVSWSDHRIDARGKTSTSYSFRCRTFTVTGTTLS
jgi:hypothetical protein